jgi:hypothetical protein
MSMMDRILRLMAERKASDVYLSAHAPAIIKINGQYIPMNSQILPVEAHGQPAGRGGAAEPDRRTQGDRRAQHGHPAGRTWAISGSARCASAAPTRR